MNLYSWSNFAESPLEEGICRNVKRDTIRWKISGNGRKRFRNQMFSLCEFHGKYYGGALISLANFYIV